MQFQLKAYCFPSFGGSRAFISTEQSSCLERMIMKCNAENKYVSVVHTMKAVFNEMLRGRDNNADSKDRIER